VEVGRHGYPWSVVAALATAGLLLAAPGARAGGPAFTTSELPLPKRHFDIGVAYVNSDSDPDLFTTAHSNRQVVLIGDGDGGFVDRLSDLGLDHSPRFSGLERLNEPPQLTDPGMYLFATPTGLSLIAHQTSAVVELRSRGFQKPKPRRGATATLKRSGRGPLALEEVRVVAPVGGRVVFPMSPRWVPVKVTVQRPAQPASILVGSDAVHPASPGFRLLLRDRHGMAWSDLDGDDDSDVYITRGALAGRLEQRPDLVRDELMMRAGGGFEDVAGDLGLSKASCRGRLAGTPDVDGDGRPDIFSSCKDGPPRLYLQRGTGIRNVSARLRRAGGTGAGMRWVDVRGSVLPELIAIDGRRLSVFGRDGGSWVLRQALTGLPGGAVDALAPADIDRDGDADLMVAIGGQTALLENRGGSLTPRDPASLGLPVAVAGPLVWADVQNDGRVDLFAPPGGVFAQKPGGGFAATGLLASGPVSKAHSSWPDIDGDGDRDAVLSVRSDGRRVSELHRNQLADGHWLQVEVESRFGGEAAGARVMVRSGGERQTGWVGQSDSARYSSGDHRLYFGLGDDQSATVNVRWPGGASASLKGVDADRLLRVPYP